MNPQAHEDNKTIESVVKAAVQSGILDITGKDPAELTKKAQLPNFEEGVTLVLVDASASMAEGEFRQIAGNIETLLLAGHPVALWGASATLSSEVHILYATCFGRPPSEPGTFYHEVDLDSSGDVSCPLRRWPFGAELSAHPTLSSRRDSSGGLPPSQASPCTGAHLCATASPPAWAGEPTSS